MLFIIAHHDRGKLEVLTQSLLLAFRGSVVYQHTDASQILREAVLYDADAVYLECQPSGAVLTSLLRSLRRKQPELPVFLISGEEMCSEVACEEYSALLHDSVQPDELVAALQAAR